MIALLGLSCTAGHNAETYEAADAGSGGRPTDTTAVTGSLTAAAPVTKLDAEPTAPGVAPTTQTSVAATELVDTADGAEIPQFVAMWDFEPDEEPMVANALLGGTLLIEERCVYLLTDEPSERWLLRLLQRATR